MTRQTVASAHARIDVVEKGQTDHEKVCAERFQMIRTDISTLKTDLKAEHKEALKETRDAVSDTLNGFRDKLDSSHRRAGRIEFAAWGLLVSLLLACFTIIAKLSGGA